MIVDLYNTDCRDAMSLFLPDCSVDAIVTDPPYGLSFMGKRWDYDVPGVDVWSECLRVLKPGGHLLAFAGTRTQHRMAVRIEDAGFEIRDMIAWVYGSGFPKSRNIAADMQEGAAAAWQGWGTALKPALEPITVARKPLAGTVAANVLAHGTGALNIDGCRVGTDDTRSVASKSAMGFMNDDSWQAREVVAGSACGRWPANLIHDGSDEVVAAFPQAKGQQGDLKGHANSRQSPDGCFGNMAPARDHAARIEMDKSAARFFYCAKASKADRGEGNNHPTVKPHDLMRYLCRLVTPPGGRVLDPFMGSGSTGRAALAEGFNFVGCELDAAYFAVAQRRLAVLKAAA